MALRAVLFDMDGVLLKSEDAWFRVVEAAGRVFRGSPVRREEFEPTFGQGTDADVEVFGFRCTPAELNAFYVAHLGSFSEGVWVNPEAVGVVAALRARGVACAVVTNTVTPLAHMLLSKAQLLDGFQGLFGADQVAHSKPAPDLLQLALKHLRCEPGEALMVGDSRFDRRAAEAAGVPFVGLGLDGAYRLEHLSELLLCPLLAAA